MSLSYRKCLFAMCIVLVILAVTRYDFFNYVPPKLAPLVTLFGRHKQLSPRYIDCNVRMVTHVRFLKVHKCASTTMQNLFFRFALRHSLSVALPQKTNYIFTKKNIIKPNNTTKHHDIFACHTKYSKAWFDAMPIPSDAINIAIVREPKERMMSAAFKYRHGGIQYLNKVPKDNFIQGLLRYPEKYDRAKFSPTKNSMGRDFGFSPNIKLNQTREIEQYLLFLEKEFDLVLIVERFHESLVLMKRVLSWDMQDIIYRVAHSYAHENVTLSNEDLLRMRELNFLDFAIYEHFEKIFERKLKSEENELQEEVQHLSETIRKVTEFCDKGMDHELEIKESKWNQKFIIDDSECNLMKTKELRFIKKLKERQTQ